MNRKIFKTLKFIGRKGLFWLSIGVVSGITLSFLELAVTYLIQILLVILGASKEPVFIGSWEIPIPNVYEFCVYLIIVGAMRSFAQFLIMQSSILSNEIIGTRLRLLAFYEALKLRLGFLSLTDMQTKLGEIFPKATLFFQYLALLIPNAIFSFALVVAMFTKSVDTTLWGLAGIAFIAVAVHFLNRRVRRIADGLPQEFKKLTSRVIRVMRNFFLLKALRTVDREHEQLVESSLSYSTRAIRANFFAQAAAMIPPVFGILLIAGLIIRHVNNPELSPGEFLAFLYLFLKFIQTLGGMAASYGVVNIHFPNFKLAAKFFFSFDFETLQKAVNPALRLSAVGRTKKKQSELPELRTHSSTGINPPEISLNTVSFRYPGAKENVIQNLNIQIGAGEMIGIQGRSGTGKSTLLALLLGILEPQSGKVTVNGKDPSDVFNQNDFRIGYVGADPFFIEGSIRENLAYGLNLKVSDEECLQAMKQAHLGDLIATLPGGLDYHLSENGEGLSTGQKQRLLLSRAFLAKPQLLVLDEISANLDLKTEAEVAESLKSLKGGNTCILVSHREGILKYADRVIYL